MRVLGFLALALWLMVGVTPLRSADLPRFRPALPGSGPTALINQINTHELIKKGQKGGGLMFCCYISRTGNVVWSDLYRPLPNSDLLKAEVERCLAKVKFFPAIYEYQLVDAVFYGMVAFDIVEGKPRLRIFANQEVNELKAESDFIGPQPIIGAGSNFTGIHYPKGIAVVMDGVGYLSLKVDAVGNLQDMHAVSEEPPLSGFADVATRDFDKAKFIPAFRNGDPVECSIQLPVYYQP
jgi:hypothetical protein